MLKDILETGEDLTGNEKGYTLTASYNGAVAWNTIERSQRNMVAQPVNVTVEQKAHCIKVGYYKQGMANFVTNGGHLASAVAEPVRIGTIESDLKTNHMTASNTECTARMEKVQLYAVKAVVLVQKQGCMPCRQRKRKVRCTK